MAEGNVSHPNVVAHWIENPYWQWFCGFEYFEHELPIEVVPLRWTVLQRSGTTSGRLGRNYLLGHPGDAVNALLCAAGHNLRLILNRLRALFALILTLFSAAQNRNTLRHPPIYAQT